MMTWHEEEHPDWGHELPRMRTLILGSYPPHSDKWDYPFFYPNTQNRFWRILAQIADHDLVHFKGNPEAAVNERKAILDKLETGVQNIAQRVSRKGKSALDTHIKIVRYQNILRTIRRHPELEQILLPGFSAPSSTFQGFKRYLAENNIAVPDEKPRPGMQFFIRVDGRDISCVVLNSTSTALPMREEDIREQFRPWLTPSGLPRTHR